MSEDQAAVTIVSLVILAGAGLLYAAMINRRKVREMEHRERLAMIERGIAPAQRPWTESVVHWQPPSAAADRFRSAGIILIGIGAGLFFIIGFAADAPGVGLGVGGAWAVVGAALLVNYRLLAQRGPEQTPAAPLTQPSARPPAEPPDNIAP